MISYCTCAIFGFIPFAVGSWSVKRPETLLFNLGKLRKQTTSRFIQVAWRGERLRNTMLIRLFPCSIPEVLHSFPDKIRQNKLFLSLLEKHLNEMLLNAYLIFFSHKREMIYQEI